VLAQTSTQCPAKTCEWPPPVRERLVGRPCRLERGLCLRRARMPGCPGAQLSDLVQGHCGVTRITAAHRQPHSDTCRLVRVTGSAVLCSRPPWACRRWQQGPAVHLLGASAEHGLLTERDVSEPIEVVECGCDVPPSSLRWASHVSQLHMQFLPRRTCPCKKSAGELHEMWSAQRKPHISHCCCIEHQLQSSILLSSGNGLLSGGPMLCRTAQKLQLSSHPHRCERHHLSQKKIARPHARGPSCSRQSA
jgi:hypothetical protein